MTLDEYVKLLESEAKTLAKWSETMLGINTDMETPTTTIPADFLQKVEWLPDGTATVNQQLFLQSWAEFTQKQIATGKLKLQDIAEYDPETGQVPNTYLYKVYTQNRRLQ